MTCSNFGCIDSPGTRANAIIPSAALSYIMQHKINIPPQYHARFSHNYYRVWEARYALELLNSAPVIVKDGVSYAPIFLKGLSLVALKEIAANAPTKKVMFAFRALDTSAMTAPVASLSPVVLIIMKKESN